VIGLCGTESIQESDPGPCYLGADVGTLVHCVIGKKHDKGCQVVYAGAFPDWSQLNSLVKRFNVVRGVIDGLPETRLSREFAKNNQGKIYCCFYNEHQKGSYGWNEKELTVTVNRTESLDASHEELRQGRVVLPRECETIQEVATQCSNIARVLQTDPETGASRYVYLKTGPDHYRHAANYFTMAFQTGSNLIFADLL